MADMAGKRPLCARGPMMSALILCSFLIKEKGRKTFYPFIILPTNPASTCPGPHSTNSVMPAASMCCTLCVQRTGARNSIYLISTK